MANLLITGGAGFIGSHTALVLLEAGHQLVVLDSYANSSPEALRRVAELAGPEAATRLQVIEGDIRSEQDLNRAFAANSAQWGKPADAVIHFTGKTRMSHPREMTAYNAARYKWVKKDIERYDVAPGDGETVVYSTGTLYGEWLNGDRFEGNRYVDRFSVVGDRIMKIDVWNDSAERLLKRAAGQPEA